MKEAQETWLRSRGREDPLQEVWQPTPVFLPGDSHGQRSLAGCNPWGAESDTTERLSSDSYLAHQLGLSIRRHSQSVVICGNSLHKVSKHRQADHRHVMNKSELPQLCGQPGGHGANSRSSLWHVLRAGRFEWKHWVGRERGALFPSSSHLPQHLASDF